MVIKSVEDLNFKPIKINITIESERELNVLVDFFGNLSVSSVKNFMEGRPDGYAVRDSKRIHDLTEALFIHLKSYLKQ